MESTTNTPISLVANTPLKTPSDSPCIRKFQRKSN